MPGPEEITAPDAYIEDPVQTLPPTSGGGLASRAKGARSNGMMPWWVYLAIFLLVLLVTGAVWWMIFSNRGALATEVGPTPRPLFVIITSTPTSLANPQAGQMSATVTPTPLNLPDATSSGPAVMFIAGQLVAITGTEGAGLSIRSEPGVGFPALSIGFDGDTYTIVEGPREADGYTWWSVESQGETGWVVEDFLVPAP